MTPAVVYCRFSPRPGAEQCDSNRTQFQRIRAYCQANDYQIVAARWDRDLSGERSDNRPGLARALADAKRHKAVLVVFKFNRMARNTEDMRRMVRERTGYPGADRPEGGRGYGRPRHHHLAQ